MRKPQRHLLMLCDIVSLVKWLICTFIARECSNHTEVITTYIKRCFSAHNSPYPATASHQMQGIPRQPGESSGMQSGKHRTVLDLLLCPRPLGRSRSVLVTHCWFRRAPPPCCAGPTWKMGLHGDGSYLCTYGNMI